MPIILPLSDSKLNYEGVMPEDIVLSTFDWQWNPLTCIFTRSQTDHSPGVSSTANYYSANTCGMFGRWPSHCLCPGVDMRMAMRCTFFLSYALQTSSWYNPALHSILHFKSVSLYFFTFLDYFLWSSSWDPLMYV